MTEKELAAQRHKEIIAANAKTYDGVESIREDVQELSRRFDLHEQNDHHVHNAHDGRIMRLENSAEASGAHNIELLQQQLAAKKANEHLWRNRVWGIISALMLAGIVGLVTHWLHTR